MLIWKLTHEQKSLRWRLPWWYMVYDYHDIKKSPKHHLILYWLCDFKLVPSVTKNVMYIFHEKLCMMNQIDNIWMFGAGPWITLRGDAGRIRAYSTRSSVTHHWWGNQAQPPVQWWGGGFPWWRYRKKKARSLAQHKPTVFIFSSWQQIQCLLCLVRIPGTSGCSDNVAFIFGIYVAANDGND